MQSYIFIDILSSDQ